MLYPLLPEKFSDVVNWLKGNAVTGDSLSAAESYKNENNVVVEIKNSEAKYFQEKTGFTPISTTRSFSPGTTTPSFSPGTTTISFSLCTTAKTFPLGSTTAGSKSSFTFGGTTAKFTSANTTTSFTSSGMTTSFATPWSSGLLSNIQTPVLFGVQSSVAVNNNASDDADEENELPQPSSPSVKKSEEKGIVVVHEIKCKLYVKSTDPADKDSWKDKGTGQLSIKCKEGIGKGSKDSKPTIVVQNDVGKFLLNALLYPGIKTSAQKNSVVAIFLTSDDGGNNGNAVAHTFLIRTKSEEDRNKLATVIQEYAPAS
ncbi:serine-rich adhesin for platelets isoform X1 [Gossypium australe]|uniref:Serine-rich adhesin for platelets isoform X1 n=1 Tax=Gossypium australe TaxID=47621 RepID=A0A5B6VII6_9ROSI|nr:serine-rich adhesin for platelets isoform X1 [Gossypium australe]